MNGPRFWIIAAVLVTATVGLHALRHGSSVPLRDKLEVLPLKVGAWEGRDLPLSERIIAAAGVDEYLNRVYVADDQVLELYIGYYKNQRTGDTIHSPKNCLPGGGWLPLSSTYTDVRAADGHSFPVNLYVIGKDSSRQMVLYWYQSHGRIIASEYWAKIYMVSDALRYNRTDGALVRIITPLNGDERLARERAVQFAEQLLPQLDKTIPR